MIHQYSPHFAHTATSLPSGQILASGGAGDVLNTTELYNPQSGSWTRTGTTLFQHYQHTATFLQSGNVLLVGGNSAPAVAEVYNPLLGQWAITGPLNVGRYQHTATLLPNGDVLVSGGSGAGVVQASAEIYHDYTLIRLRLARANGAMQFTFGNVPGGMFRVLASPSLDVPESNWPVIGFANEGPPGEFKFIDTAPTFGRRFYTVRSQ